MQQYLQCGRYRLTVTSESFNPLVMGILNVTPDSFSDGGRFHTLDAAVSRAKQMIAEGVDIIDIGGSSSRPGALPLTVEEEMARVMPVLYALRYCGKPISIDTCQPVVMREVLVAGADMINDIGAFLAPGALDAVKDSDCALCIMHMQNVPQNMQLKPVYQDVVGGVTSFLQDRVDNLAAAGIQRNRLCIDPGFGFGKTFENNLDLFKNIGKIQSALDLPLLAGLSYKSMIGTIVNKSVEKRLAGSLAAALAAAMHGARILRVHDVAETVDAFKIWQAAI
jgi:dihydropteroate synthase